MKAYMTLHCDCGCGEFTVCRDVEGYDYSVVCTGCGNVVCTVPSYAIQMKNEEQEEEKKAEVELSVSEVA